MTFQTSWRMLAVSAAVAVMLTACGSGGDGSDGAAGANGANVSGTGTGTGTVAATPTNVRVSVDSATNTATVTLVDAAGNVVPVTQQVTVEVPAGSGNTLPVDLTNGVGTFPLPSGGNGTDIGVTDPSSGQTFTTTVPGVRFSPNSNGTVTVTLVDANGKPFTGSQATVTGTDGLVADGTTVDLSSGNGTFPIDTNTPNPGLRDFKVTDADGNTFTGSVDTGSYTDSNGYYVLGCHASSPSNTPSSDWATVSDSSNQQVTGDLTSGGTYTFKFTLQYSDSAGNALPPGSLSRNVQVRIQAGEAEINGVQEKADPNTNYTPITDALMKDGSVEVELKQIANGPNAEPSYNPAQSGFRLGVRDGACADALPQGTTWNSLGLRKAYEKAYTVVTP